MKDDAVLTLAAMLCLTLIEIMALAKGIDSALLVFVVGVISTLGGYKLKAWRTKP